MHTPNGARITTTHLKNWKRFIRDTEDLYVQDRVTKAKARGDERSLQATLKPWQINFQTSN